MVDAVEVFAHIALEVIGKAVGEVLRPLNRGVGTFADAAGISIENQTLFENRFEDVAHGVMDDALRL